MHTLLVTREQITALACSPSHLAIATPQKVAIFTKNNSTLSETPFINVKHARPQISGHHLLVEDYERGITSIFDLLTDTHLYDTPLGITRATNGYYYTATANVVEKRRLKDGQIVSTTIYPSCPAFYISDDLIATHSGDIYKYGELSPRYSINHSPLYAIDNLVWVNQNTYFKCGENGHSAPHLSPDDCYLLNTKHLIYARDNAIHIGPLNYPAQGIVPHTLNCVESDDNFFLSFCVGEEWKVCVI